MKKCHFIPQKEEEEETNLSTYMYDTVYIEESKREREREKKRTCLMMTMMEGLRFSVFSSHTVSYSVEQKQFLRFSYMIF